MSVDHATCMLRPRCVKHQPLHDLIEPYCSSARPPAYVHVSRLQVSFQGKQRLMGEGAASVARSNFKNTVREVKRLVGRVWGSPDLEADLQRMPFKCM